MPGSFTSTAKRSHTRSTIPSYNTGSDVVDPTAEVSPRAQLGKSVKVWNWTKIREDAVIGDGTSIGQCCYIDVGVSIGRNCKIQNGISIYNGVTIGDDVLIGPNVTFTNDLYPRADVPDWVLTPTVIENGVGIGANATIVCGTVLRERCMIGAGSVVCENVAANVLVYGAPARPMDYVTDSGKPLNWDMSLGQPPGHLLQA